MATSKQYDAHLVVTSTNGEPSLEPVVEPLTTIGSAATATIRLSDPEADEVHVEIERHPRGFLVKRSGSRLWINGRRASSVQPLQDGDLITLGRTAISFRQGAIPRPPSQRGRSDGDANAHAYEVLGRLQALSRQLYAGEPLQDMIDRIIKDVVELTEAHRGMLVLFEGDPAIKTAGAQSCHGDFDSTELRMSRTAIAKIRENPRPQLWTDVGTDPDLAVAPSIHAARVSSLMAAPVLIGERPVGALFLCRSNTGDRFVPGQLDLLSVYATQAALLLASASRDHELSQQVQQIRRDLDIVREQTVLGSSPTMREVMAKVSKVGRSTIAVLIVGETGTGKELLARELHRHSTRADGPFVPVNCGAIPGNLLESELFGHVRGAFTDATADRAGRLRSAAGGTLFLDEIGEMPLDQQAKLLRVLQEREVVPLGGDKAYAVDFRLLCATNQRLDQQLAQGRFRRDLYYRIAGFVLDVPPLRERSDDAIELARFFIQRHGVLLQRPNVRLSAAAMTAIRAHPWEGNVRELEGAVHRALVVAETDIIQPDDLGLAADAASSSTAPPQVLPLVRARDDFLKQYVRQVVKSFDGNRTAAAKALRITPRTVFKYLDEV